ncbi:Aquaporin SIP1-1 [Zea mays]|uniref:protein-serine/threonine phosphatase n=1 Tax=Zea mays TaxID=4577 RepID=A0A3L6DHY6_MAIZE|nr:Aquaporin SIP1-1 [Zea mays]
MGGALAISEMIPVRYKHTLASPSLKVDPHTGPLAEGVLTFVITLTVLWVIIKGPCNVILKTLLLSTSIVPVILAGAEYTRSSVNPANLSNAGGRLIISSDSVWDAWTIEMAFKCARGLPPEAATEQIVKEAVEAKGLRDDTTCIVIDIISPEKPKRTIQSQRTPGKGLVLLKN